MTIEDADGVKAVTKDAATSEQLLKMLLRQSSYWRCCYVRAVTENATYVRAVIEDAESYYRQNDGLNNITKITEVWNS